MTIRGYAFVGSEQVRGGPFTGAGDSWGEAYAELSAAIVAAIATAHNTPLAERLRGGAILTVTAEAPQTATEPRTLEAR